MFSHEWIRFLQFLARVRLSAYCGATTNGNWACGEQHEQRPLVTRQKPRDGWLTLGLTTHCEQIVQERTRALLF